MTAIEAALAGATVLTSSKRLSRVLTQFVQRGQRERGLSVWRTPPILPLDAFVRKCFDEWLYSGRASACPSVLNSVQEEAAWEQIILTADGSRLLQPWATARAAGLAWGLAHGWRVSLKRANLTVSEDCEAFFGWAARFIEKSRDEGWLDSARLMDFVRERIAAGEIEVPARFALAGFDEFTPQQRDFVETLRGSADSGLGQLGLFSAPLRTVEECAPAEFAAIPMLRPLLDSSHELGAAAEWAREILLRNPREQIGIIVPKLASMRARVDRIFGDVLHPGAFPDGDRAYHISAGRPLAEYPIVNAALLLIETALDRISASTAGLMLRSPFLKGAEEERDARAAADLQLRRRREAELSLEELRRYAASCPRLEACLRAAQKEGTHSAHQTPSAWSRAFARMIAAFGWPGDRTPDSAEFQTINAWNRALSALASLDRILPLIDAGEALLRLRRIASNTTFQPENEAAPVQILGTLEASGLTFDHLWMTGLDDETLPPAARPNPFLPLPVQLARGMPHCSAQRELEFAGRTLRRLVASAPEVTLSYARTNGERELSPSPLLAEIPHVSEPCPEGAFAMRRWFQPARVEEIVDQIGPPLESTAPQRGGAALLKAMAACPFQAFAAYRLNAPEMEEADFGLSASDRGRIVHKAMELVWNELGSQAALRAMAHGELDQLVERCAADAAPGESAMSAIERGRLRVIIMDWLRNVELPRRPFTVGACEQRENVVVGDLGLEVRVDRIDRLADGRLAIIDYKTGKIDHGCWEGDRPAEPQLPLYAVTCSDPLGAVHIAVLRRDGMELRRLDDGACYGFKDRSMRLATALAEWKRVLPVLAGQFRAGVATVDPRGKACNFCRFPALCRVKDSAELTEDDDDAAE